MAKGKSKAPSKGAARIKVGDLAAGRREAPRGGSVGDEAGTLKGIVLSDATLSVRPGRK